MPETKPDFDNPMGFYCAPNGTDPHYGIEHDFRNFVAYGMMQSANHLVGDGTDAIMATVEDVYWLRDQFLDELEIALVALTILKEEEEERAIRGYLKPHSYQGDHAEGGPSIPCEVDDRSPEDTLLTFQWQLERYDSGNAGDEPSLLFVLDWGESEDFSIWLSANAIGDDAKAIIAEARKINDAIGEYEE